MKKKILTGLAVLFFTVSSFNSQAQEGMLAEVKLFAGNFAPRGWAFCHGQLLPISQNNALFALLGTTYGGDGRTTFALPDLRSRVPVGVGRGPGLTDRKLGEPFGRETTTLTVANLPAHSHEVAGTKNGNDKKKNTVAISNASTDTTAAGSTSDTGAGNPINNIQPSLGLNYIICMQGIFPSRS